jgi:hypothetical protein
LVRFLSKLGPGLVAGAADDDPSGIGTYSIAGAQFGYTALWTAWFLFPLMAGVQLICARLGMVSGRGLGGLLRKHYGRWALWPACLLLVIANVANIAADLGAMAASTAMVTGIPAWCFTPLYTILMAVLIGRISYHAIARVFKWLTLVLFAYIIAAFFAHPDWGRRRARHVHSAPRMVPCISFHLRRPTRDDNIALSVFLAGHPGSGGGAGPGKSDRSAAPGCHGRGETQLANRRDHRHAVVNRDYVCRNPDHWRDASRSRADTHHHDCAGSRGPSSPRLVSLLISFSHWELSVRGCLAFRFSPVPLHLLLPKGQNGAIPWLVRHVRRLVSMPCLLPLSLSAWG